MSALAPQPRGAMEVHVYLNCRDANVVPHCQSGQRVPQFHPMYPHTRSIAPAGPHPCVRRFEEGSVPVRWQAVCKRLHLVVCGVFGVHKYSQCLVGCGGAHVLFVTF